MRGAALREDDARRLLLVRAVESEDRGEALLTREDRQQAHLSALSAQQVGGTVAGGRADEAYLARRSQFAFTRLTTRFPALESALSAAHWPRWLNWSIPAAAFLLGAFANEIDSGRRLNIIAFPLLGMLAWNLVIYVLLAVGAARRIAGAPGTASALLARPAHWIAGLSRLGADTHQPIGRAMAGFAREWAEQSKAITYHRANRTLHLSAAALAAGAVSGMYLRALGFEYRAGWESTFIGAESLHVLLGLVLAPASAIIGIDLPTAERLAQLRWDAGSAGENAGPWIHLYAATALLFILLPRLILAVWSAGNVLRLRRHFPVPGREDFYVRRLLRGAHGHGAEVRIVPYSFHPPHPARRSLQFLLADALGDTTRTTIDAPIEYGAEDEWLAASSFGTDVDYLLLLFSLSATPEAENQGALVAGIRHRLGQSGTVVAAVLDESAYRQRLAGMAGAEARVDARRLAWERVMGQHGLKPLSMDLENAAPAALAERFEAGLLQEPALTAAKSAG
jgi:hypothetical protein